MSTSQEPERKTDTLPHTLSMDEFHALIEGNTVPEQRPAPARPLAEYLRQFERSDRESDSETSR